MKKNKIHPYIIIIISFLGIILTGTVLLAMPFTTTKGGPWKGSLGFVDSLFMATSATCVTGLSVVELGTDFTIYGKIVMAILMEIGGLSFITIAVFFFTMIGAKIGVSSRFLLRESLNQSSNSGLITLVRKIIITSFCVQIICALINMITFVNYYSTWYDALAVSLFHSAAAFNNAGFDVFGNLENNQGSMIIFKDNVLINATTMVMIILGSMGFIVIDEIVKKRRWKKLSLHAKLALVTTFVLVVGGAVFIKLSMHDKSFTWLQAFFGSITCRTAGFTTYDLSNLKNSPGAYIIYVILMLVGASPCGTGGGVKTTTLAVVIIAITYYARGKQAKAFKRKISNATIFKAFSLIGMCVLIVVIGSFLMTVFQPHIINSETGYEYGIQEILFEVSSAFSTTGLSMGITGSLNSANRILLCFIMFFGRLGPLTIVGVVNKNWLSASKENIQYVEEKVIIG